jgi:hypothetical protein
MELQVIQNKIYEIRGHKVMLDFDLAKLYEVENKRLKEAVRRNIDRFPSDFMFELTKTEYNSLRKQIAYFDNLRSQIASSSWGGSRYVPFAFTEQGVAMLASILNSPKAIQVNISIIRAFVLMRQLSYNYKELAGKIKALELKYNRKFTDVYKVLDLLLMDHEEKKEAHENWKKRKLIGYK